MWRLLHLIDLSLARKMEMYSGDWNGFDLCEFVWYCNGELNCFSGSIFCNWFSILCSKAVNIENLCMITLEWVVFKILLQNLQPTFLVGWNAWFLLPETCKKEFYFCISDVVAGFDAIWNFFLHVIACELIVILGVSGFIFCSNRHLQVVTWKCMNE